MSGGLRPTKVRKKGPSGPFFIILGLHNCNAAQLRVEPTSVRSEGTRREKPSLVRVKAAVGAKPTSPLNKPLGRHQVWVVK